MCTWGKRNNVKYEWNVGFLLHWVIGGLEEQSVAGRRSVLLIAKRFFI